MADVQITLPNTVPENSNSENVPIDVPPLKLNEDKESEKQPTAFLIQEAKDECGGTIFYNVRDDKGIKICQMSIVKRFFSRTSFCEVNELLSGEKLSFQLCNNLCNCGRKWKVTEIKDGDGKLRGSMSVRLPVASRRMLPTAANAETCSITAASGQLLFKFNLQTFFSGPHVAHPRGRMGRKKTKTNIAVMCPDIGGDSVGTITAQAAAESSLVYNVPLEPLNVSLLLCGILGIKYCFLDLSRTRCFSVLWFFCFVAICIPIFLLSVDLIRSTTTGESGFFF